MAYVLAGMLLAGCGSLGIKPDPPRFTLAGFSLVSMELIEQRFNLRLRVQNPNDSNLSINAMRYQLRLDDQPFAEGVSSQNVTIPSFGWAVLEVEAVSNLAGLMRNFNGFGRSKRSTVRYQLVGTVILNPDNLRLPFDQSGEVALPSALFDGNVLDPREIQ